MPTPLDRASRTLVGSSLPRTPSPTAKRLVFGYRGAQLVVLIVGLGFSGLGGLLSLIFCWGLPSDVMLSVSGVTGQGVVIDTQLNQSVEVNGVNPTTVHFAYTVDGQRFEAHTDTLDDTLERVEPGAEVSIEYLSSDPGVARVAGETRATFGFWGVFVLAFPVIGVLMTRSVVRANRREIRAYQYGEPITARVTGFAEDTSTALNDRHPWMLTWEFTRDGRTYTGSLSSMRRDELQPFADAQDVTVLVLPDDPSANTLYVP